MRFAGVLTLCYDAGMQDARFGLCDMCVNQRVIETTRGSAFSMCRIGLRDPDWPKYPRMPVVECSRYEVRQALTDE